MRCVQIILAAVFAFGLAYSGCCCTFSGQASAPDSPDSHSCCNQNSGADRSVPDSDSHSDCSCNQLAERPDATQPVAYLIAESGVVGKVAPLIHWIFLSPERDLRPNILREARGNAPPRYLLYQSFRC